MNRKKTNQTGKKCSLEPTHISAYILDKSKQDEDPFITMSYIFIVKTTVHKIALMFVSHQHLSGTISSAKVPALHFERCGRHSVSSVVIVVRAQD